MPSTLTFSKRFIEDGIRSYLDEDLRKQYLADCDGDTRDEQNVYYQPTDFGAVIGISHVKAMAWGSDGSLAELRQEAIKSRPRPSE